MQYANHSIKTLKSLDFLNIYDQLDFDLSLLIMIEENLTADMEKKEFGGDINISQIYSCHKRRICWLKNNYTIRLLIR